MAVFLQDYFKAQIIKKEVTDAEDLKLKISVSLVKNQSRRST